MTNPRTFAGSGLLVAFAAMTGGCAKPCEPIPVSATIKSLGFVLEGGRVCRDENGAATVDYPDADEGALVQRHKDALTKAGWTVENPSGGVLYTTKAKSTLFIVTGKKSSERRVPFSVVKYRLDETCRKSMRDLATAMKKY